MNFSVLKQNYLVLCADFIFWTFTKIVYEAESLFCSVMVSCVCVYVCVCVCARTRVHAHNLYGFLPVRAHHKRQEIVLQAHLILRGYFLFYLITLARISCTVTHVLREDEEGVCGQSECK